MNFSIIVPVYNNNNTLQKVLQHIQRNFAGLPHTFEVVFVNDGSMDESLQTLLKLREQHENIAIVDLSRNYNQATAVVAGFAHAQGEYCIVISADLQEEELIIAKLISNLEQNPDADLILGVRAQNSDYLVFRILSVLFYKIIKLKIRNMPEGGFDSGLVRKDLARKIIANYYEGIFLQAAFLQLSENTKHVKYKRLKSSAEKVQLKSLVFKIRYFIHCILQVYFPGKDIAEKGKPVYTVEQFFDKQKHS